jgi:hypothetical protein
MAIGVKKLKPGKKRKTLKGKFRIFPLKKDFLHSKKNTPLETVETSQTVNRFTIEIGLVFF